MATLSRREFAELASLAVAGSMLPGLPSRPQQAITLEETTIAQLQDGMKAGRLTARGVTQAYLDRIAALDRQGPTLRAVLETNPDALTIADALDGERRRGKVRGPLHGIPVIVKDNIDTHDKMQTTAGSLALEGNVAVRDASIVERLRAAGAVILAKANLSEWANFRSSRSSSGWSGRGRQCRNPYVLDRTPSGSSSGSAVSVSANLCAVAVGTETDGSIISPANTCGIVGIKPTVGLVSRAGIIPIAHSQDTAGPMARTVADAAALHTALAGVDRAGSLPYASSLCGACGEVCPVKIDIPKVLVHLRGRVTRETVRAADPERIAMRALAWSFGDERRFERAQKAARVGQLPFARGGRIERLPGLAGWTRTRDLPALPAQTFREWWDQRRSPS